MFRNMGVKSGVARSGEKTKQPSLTITSVILPHKNKSTSGTLLVLELLVVSVDVDAMDQWELIDVVDLIYFSIHLQTIRNAGSKLTH